MPSLNYVLYELFLDPEVHQARKNLPGKVRQRIFRQRLPDNDQDVADTLHDLAEYPIYSGCLNANPTAASTPIIVIAPSTTSRPAENEA
jgi:hypothetical protein